MKNLLCFGDSNTWGYNPLNKERYSKEIRWTGKLQNKLGENKVHVIEKGLCGRTTIFEDINRPNRKGLSALPKIFQNHPEIDSVVLMLGTNDCKKHYNNTAQSIAKGISECLDFILEYIPAEKILLVSPIELGKEVWRDSYDPEFDADSIDVSRQLKKEYEKIAKKKKIHFLAASEYAEPSEEDQEHLNVIGHQNLAEAIYEQVVQNLRCA